MFLPPKGSLTPDAVRAAPHRTATHRIRCERTLTHKPTNYLPGTSFVLSHRIGRVN